jgi:hypothetical protein
VPGRAYRAVPSSCSPAPLGSRTPPTGAVGITAAAPVPRRVRRAVAGDVDLVPDASLGDVRRPSWSAPVCPPLTTRSSMARMPSAARSTAPTSAPLGPSSRRVPGSARGVADGSRAAAVAWRVGWSGPGRAAGVAPAVGIGRGRRPGRAGPGGVEGGGRGPRRGRGVARGSGSVCPRQRPGGDPARNIRRERRSFADRSVRGVRRIGSRGQSASPEGSSWGVPVAVAASVYHSGAPWGQSGPSGPASDGSIGAPRVPG